MAVPAFNIASSFFPLQRPPCPRIRQDCFGFRCRSSLSDEEEYLLDAPVSIGDGFSFSGGKYAQGSSRFDEWFAQGKMVMDDAKQPIPEAEKEASDEPSLICPVCLSVLNELSSTTCGRVFCSSCIEKAIEKHKKCPTCRKKLN